MSKKKKRRDPYDLPVKNVEVVPRLTPEEARELFAINRPEFEHRSMTVVTKYVTTWIKKFVLEDFRGQHSDELHSEGLMALTRCLSVLDGRPVPADDGDDQAGDDQADDDQADDEQGDDQHPLDDWPNYIIKAAKRRCKRYLDKAMRPLNWVVQPEARRASRSSRTAVGSPEYHQMIRQTEGRGKEYEPRIESAFGFRFLEQRDQQILVMHQDGYSQADIAKELKLAASTVSGLIAKARDFLKDAEA